MASSSSASDSQWKYDVFLSFRGADTRRTFTGHLYEGLKNRGIFTFQDDKRLEDGDCISEELLKAIEESQIALIIFSKNYATSSWCLDELMKIMKCKEKNQKLVIPVFYDVDPSHVRKQTESFAEAFAQHKSRYVNDVEGMQKMESWRTALTAAANLKGHDIRDRIESDCIQDIVDQVSSKLCKASVSYLRNVVGINTHLENVNSLLEMEVNDVRIVGIWGMGGVGKTTIARAIFDTLSPQFGGACFLADIKENKGGIYSLQNILLSELLREDKKHVNNNEDGKHMIARRLRFKKVLVVLDDIDHSDHLDNLAGDLDWFGKGSRIIATTRNKQILGKNNAVYAVTTLLEHDAIQLFNHYAFKDETPDEHTKELALEVVNHAKGLPLALKLWGIMLHNKDTTMWTEVVDMIKRESNVDIVQNLKISFEGLQDTEKTIFLDIACFFRGNPEDETIKILESYDAYARIRFHGLIEKSLVFISQYNTIQMHDLIQDMGQYVVKMQKDSGRPTRLWKDEDFEDVMVNNMETMAVEAIWISRYYSEKLRFIKNAIKNMQRLRILYIPYRYSKENDGFIEYLSNNLRWFVWDGYPWKLLPQNFNPTRLVHLQLRSSSLQHLWNETKELSSLRKLDLSRSKSLKITPNFTIMPNLEYLDLSKCNSLEEVHHSLGCCRKLIKLNLSNCERLKRFPYVNVESLNSLNLWSCSGLEKLPEFLGIMELKLEIKVSRSVRYPRGNIHLQPHLTKLDWSGIDVLVALPSFICKLKYLVKLDVSRSKLESLPEEIADLENLEVLDASNTLISQSPSSITRLNKLKVLIFAKEEVEDEAHFVFPEVNEGLLSLEQLDLRYCNLIDGGLPEDIGCLSSLKKLNLSGNHFEHLPRSIAQLGALQSLELPGCNKLKEFPGFTGMTNLDTLNLNYCKLIDGVLPEEIGCLSSLKVLNLSRNNFEHLPQSITQLGALRSLDLSGCDKLKDLPGFTGMPNLETLDLSYCDLIDGGLPEDIGSLSSLKQLHLRGIKFKYLPRSRAQLSALQNFNLSRCYKLKELPGFTGMPNLDTLDLSYCDLGELPEDIGSLSSLKQLDLTGNKFEHLPRSVAQLGALQNLNLSRCKKLKELPCFKGMPNLDILNLSYCNLIDGGLKEDIGSLSSLRVLNLSGNKFEHLPQSIAQLGALRSLDLSDCNKLTQLPKILQQLHTIDANWNNDSICNSLFQNISVLQRDISVSDSLSLRVFVSQKLENIPSWFEHQSTGASGISVHFRENWYASDNFLGFAVCYYGKSIDEIHSRLIPLRNDGNQQMTKFALSNQSKSGMHFLLVPFASLWDASKANGKKPNDYGCFNLYPLENLNNDFGVPLWYKDEAELQSRFFSTGVQRKFGVRLLYKDELQIGMRRSRDEEASCSSNKKQRSQFL